MSTIVMKNEKMFKSDMKGQKYDLPPLYSEDTPTSLFN